MAYTKTNWQTGDVIDATKLNHAEDGIAQAQETADTANARDSLADLTDVEITGTPTTGSLLRLSYTPNGDKWQPYTLPKFMDQWQWINETSPNENRLQYNASTIYSWLGNSNGHMYRVKIGKRIIGMTEYYADLVNNIYEFRFEDVVYRATAGNEKPVVVEDGIGALSDVNITTPTDGQVMLYDATNSKWVNGSASTPEVTLTINSNGYLSMTGSDLETAAATSKVCLVLTSLWTRSVTVNNKTIQMSASPGRYYLTAFAHLAGTSYRNFYFQGLHNVGYFQSTSNSSSPQAKYSETGLNDNVNVIITSPTAGQVLKYDGSHWVNAAVSIPSYVEYAQASLVYGYNNDYETDILVMQLANSSYTEVPTNIVSYISNGAGNMVTVVSTGDMYCVTKITQDANGYTIYTSNNAVTFVENSTHDYFVLQST